MNGFSTKSKLLVLFLSQYTNNVTSFGGLQALPKIFSSSNLAQQQRCLTTTSLNAEPIKITMPALSSTMKEGRIVSWLKSEGDAVEAGEAIMVVESDKADMDVEAFEEGYIAKILIEEGESAPVGDLVALIASEESEIAEVAAMADGNGAAAPAPEAAATEGGSSGYSVETTEIFMPALSSTMVEGKIVSWLKSPGDEIRAGDALMVVESDKADMDVEAFEDGFLAAILTEEGETAEVGAPVGVIVSDEADVAVVQAGPTTTAAPAAAAPVAAAAAPDVAFTQIDMPALSSTMKEGKVVSWLKNEGDAISPGDAIMVVESDKADMDVEAFEEGYLAAIVTPEGESTAVGTPVALIAENEADISALQAYAATLSGAPAPVASSAPAASAPSSAAATPATPKATAASTGERVVASPLAKKLAAELGVDISTVAGTGPGGRITASDIEAAKASGPAKAAPASPVPTKPKHTPLPGVVAATPMARALAKKAKLDLSTIEGTGEFGRVTVNDIKLATGEIKPPKKKRATSGEPEVEMPSGFVPFTSMQRGVSNNMEATLSIPVFRVTRQIEMDKFDALYQKLKKDGVSVSSLLSKAVGLAVEKYPIMNSCYKNGGIQYNEDINVAMAVALNGGLITPTLKNANEKSVLELGAEWRELVGKAKEGKLSPDEYTTGTFLISNLGMFGVSEFDAILPQGMGCILAIGATQAVVVPCAQSVLGLKTVKKMSVTITCDHRPIYGADAAMFLQALADIMENRIDRLN